MSKWQWDLSVRHGACTLFVIHSSRPVEVSALPSSRHPGASPKRSKPKPQPEQRTEELADGPATAGAALGPIAERPVSPEEFVTAHPGTEESRGEAEAVAIRVATPRTAAALDVLGRLDLAVRALVKGAQSLEIIANQIGGRIPTWPGHVGEDVAGPRTLTEKEPAMPELPPELTAAQLPPEDEN